MTFYLFLWFSGLIFTLIKGNFVQAMGSELFAPDLLTILISYVFLRYGQTSACFFALSQGIFIDLFSGGMHGFFTVLFLIVLCGIWLGSRLFNLQTQTGQIVIVFFAMLLKKVFFFIMLSFFSQGAFFSNSFLWISIGLIIFTGLIAPILHYYLDYLSASALKNKPSKDQ